tara:strand:- start:882 stop:1172 length:291 start_codon:yes stop_codon:yes gene_type:complete
MNSNQYKILAAKVYSQNKNWEFGVSQTTVVEIVSALKEAASNVGRIAELEKQTVESFLNSGFVLPKRSKSDFYAPAYNEAVQDMIAKLKEYINKDG